MTDSWYETFLLFPGWLNRGRRSGRGERSYPGAKRPAPDPNLFYGGACQKARRSVNNRNYRSFDNDKYDGNYHGAFRGDKEPQPPCRCLFGRRFGFQLVSLQLGEKR